MRSITATACLVAAAVALTARPAASQISHLGQNISDHVVLRDGSLSGRYVDVCQSASFQDRGLFRVFPDGSQASDQFTVPAGRRLVITDVEWTVSATSLGLPLKAGSTVRIRVRIGSGTTLTSVFLSETIPVEFAGTNISGSQQLTTGFVVAPNTAICPGTTEFSSGTVIAANLVEFVMRGYLINAP